jgi:hypothetical protein
MNGAVVRNIHRADAAALAALAEKGLKHVDGPLDWGRRD